ncbi:hypothetical protein H4R18_001756 [Coemansia javaensis]|uniref:Origin recognition complex subunit 6 n=1 Tax=Coemansia javaensis TaxID=2761396 RepID=A0A9W8HBR4_9FUNG|nr:hypothetical protein H4R18_001756 [Coemansia javaensis]
MAAILAEYLGKLQLEDAPGVASKAAQFFDQVGQRMAGGAAGGSGLALCRPTVAIQLACESLSVEFNEAAACSVSSVAPPAYRACVREARVLLGINRHVTLEELDVQFGPPPGIIEGARRLLDEFRRTLGATMPAAVSRSMNWGDSAYVAAAFFLACKHSKKRVVPRAELLAAAAVKPAVFTTAVAKLAQFGKQALADIAAGRIAAAPKTPRKRAREDAAAAPDTPATPLPPPSPPRAAAVEPDEIGTIARKRVRRTIQQPAPTEPAARTRAVRPQPRTPPDAASPPRPEAQETPVKRKRGRPPLTPAQRAAKEAAREAEKKAAAQPKKAAAAARLRIGTVAMVKDQDYRASQQYSNYRLWKANMLKAH